MTHEGLLKSGRWGCQLPDRRSCSWSRINALVLTLILCLVSPSLATASSQFHEDEPLRHDTYMECLADFKDSIVDASHSLSNWDLASFSTCSFTGVYCWNNMENKVLSLKLSNLRLAGDPFPAGLAKCKASVQILDLSSNSFSVPLPRNLCQQLPYLTTLDLSYNMFFGDIPFSFKDCTYLQTLNLQGNRLSGHIPSELATLPHLTKLDLSSNSLSGPIPAELATLPHLTKLDLSSNSLSGPIPSSFLLIFEPFQCSAFYNNPHLLWPSQFPCPHHIDRNDRHLHIIIEITSSAALVLLLLILTFTLRWRSLNRKTSTPTSVEMFDQHLRLSWKSLQQATSDFNHANILGAGGSSTVYKGKLHNGKLIAIKVLQSDKTIPHSYAQQQFFTELDVLGKLRHRNLVRILGYCNNLQETMAIILDFMPMGSLHARLHNQITSTHVGSSQQLGNRAKMDWESRFRILLGIAEGLAYLHHEYDGKRCVIHGDLKPGNVLLDEDMEAHIADFGLARMVGASSTTSIATPSRQTMLCSAAQWWSFGYTAPECAQQGVVSRKADVFSFGVTLLEVVTGEMPSSSKLEEGETLADWVGKALIASASGAVQGIVAPTLKESNNWKKWDAEIVAVLELGCRCTSYKPTARPHMHQVQRFLQDLASTRNSLCPLSANALHTQYMYNDNHQDELWMLSSMS